MHSPTQTSCFREFPLWVNISMTEHLGHTEYQPITPHGMWTCKCYVISGPLLHAHTGFNQLSSNSEVLCQCGLSLSSHATLLPPPQCGLHANHAQSIVSALQQQHHIHFILWSNGIRQHTLPIRAHTARHSVFIHSQVDARTHFL